MKDLLPLLEATSIAQISGDTYLTVTVLSLRWIELHRQLLNEPYDPRMSNTDLSDTSSSNATFPNLTCATQTYPILSLNTISTWQRRGSSETPSASCSLPLEDPPQVRTTSRHSVTHDAICNPLVCSAVQCCTTSCCTVVFCGLRCIGLAASHFPFICF
jgi:hypothetical protein